ncbi:MAG: flagellar hook-length control protein FliK [Oscillibacter sp.]|nr:flagellar hook-length control protein FliK [Oscillibacter sp.]
MEQLTMLNLMQTPNGSKPSTGSKNNDSDEFRKLMESQGGGESVKPGESQPASGTEKPSETQDVPAEGVAKPVQNDPELEKQMVLAAMAMLQNPVVQAIAEETPQVLTDPAWEKGLEPVGFDDYGGTRVVHWVNTDKPIPKLSEEAKEAVVQWLEGQEPDKTEAADLALEMVPKAETPADEMDVEVLKVNVAQENALEAEAGAETETDDLFLQEGMAERPVFEDVREVPVKVGEAPTAEKPSEPVEVQVGKQLETALAKGETKVEIQLTPDSLGKIRVEVTLREDGGLLVQLHAENSRTQGILEKNLAGLESLLGRNSQQEVQVEVPRHQESQQQNLFDQQQKEQQQQQQQQQRREHPQNSEDFLQQLRLGLIGPEEVF